MTLGRRQFAAIAVAALCALALVLGRAGAAEPQLTPLAVEMLSPPGPVPVMGSDGRRHLVYELRIDNRSGGEVELKTIDAIDPTTGSVLLNAGSPDSRDQRCRSAQPHATSSSTFTAIGFCGVG